MPNRNNNNNAIANNTANSSNSGDQLIDALENISMSTNQTHQPPHFKYDTDPKIWLKKYEKPALLNGWRESHKIKNFAKYVSDDVLNWITESYNSLENISWLVFKNGHESRYKTQAFLSLLSVHSY